MSTRLQRKVGADDLANSVIKSMFIRISQKRLPVNVSESEDFWRFLVAVSLNKIRKKAEYYGRDKRNDALEVPLYDLESMVSEQGEPSDEGGELVARVLERLESELDEDGKIILSGRIEGLTNRQIASQLNDGLGRSTKTVMRRWKAIEERARAILAHMEGGSKSTEN